MYDYWFITTYLVTLQCVECSLFTSKLQRKWDFLGSKTDASWCMLFAEPLCRGCTSLKNRETIGSRTRGCTALLKLLRRWCSGQNEVCSQGRAMQIHCHWKELNCYDWTVICELKLQCYVLNWTEMRHRECFRCNWSAAGWETEMNSEADPKQPLRLWTLKPWLHELNDRTTEGLSRLNKRTQLDGWKAEERCKVIFALFTTNYENLSLFSWYWLNLWIDRLGFFLKRAIGS